MFNFLRARQPDLTAYGDGLSGRDGTVPLEASPTEAFLAENSKRLNTSMGFNTAVAAFIKNMRTTSVIDEIRDSAIRVMDDYGYSASEGSRIKSAEEFSNNVLNLIITRTRYQSTLPLSVKGGLAFLRGVVADMPSQPAADAINCMNDESRLTISKETNGLLSAMTDANEAGDAVVFAATSSLLADSSRAKSLLEETKGELSEDALLRELVSLFSVDWHHPIPAESILRAHVSGDNIDENRYIAAFADRVAEVHGTDDPYASIRELAELALRFGNFKTDDASVGNFLRMNQSNWKQNQLASKGLSGFVQSEIAGVREAVEDIIGTGKPDGFRGYVTEADVARAIARTNILQPWPSRSQRNKQQRGVHAKQCRQEEQGIIDRLRKAEVVDIEPRKLAIMRNGQLTIFETPSAAAKHFAGRAGERSQAYAEDVDRIMHYLAEAASFIGPGTARLQSQKITYERKSIPLRRLAPNRIAGLNLNDQFMRAVFGVYDGGTIIIDSVGTHEDFNKKYHG